MLALQKNIFELEQNLGLHKHIYTIAQRSGSLTDNLGKAFDCIASLFLQKTHVITHAKIIVEAIVDGLMTGVEFIQKHLKMIFSKECMNKFVPYKILHEMDFAGGTLSYEGIEALWMAEELWNYEHGVLLSSSTLKLVAEVVESVTNDQRFEFPMLPHKTDEDKYKNCRKKHKMATSICSIVAVDSDKNQKKISIYDVVENIEMLWKSLLSDPVVNNEYINRLNSARSKMMIMVNTKTRMGMEFNEKSW